LKDIPAGTTFSVERLIGLMIYDSDNTAANMLTGLLGLDYLNDSFRGFGLKNTALSRRIADYKMRDRGVENYTTASDMSMLMEKIYTPPARQQGYIRALYKNNEIDAYQRPYPQISAAEVTVAHKTGLENGVCHDAGIVFSRKGDLFACSPDIRIPTACLPRNLSAGSP
jgi:beta-lactamase class A